MNPFIVQALERLYGPDAANRLGPPIQALLGRAAAAIPPDYSSHRPSVLSQRDAMLICYADQVYEEGMPPLRSLCEFAGDYLKDLISGIHLLPFYPWSSDDGFAVKDYLAVDPANGSWEDIMALGADFDLMFDAVVNHASVQGEWFRKFLADDPAYRGFFVTVSGHPSLSEVVRPRALPLLTEFATSRGRERVWTTFSTDQADLNYKNPAVLMAILEVLLAYVSKGAKFIRLDAIAFLWKEIGTPCLHLPQTHLVIQLFRAALNEVAPQVQLITETNVPHADNISYFGDGTNEAQLVYNFALPPLVLHSFRTGSARSLSSWAQSLAPPSDKVTFFNFLASHDGIGLNPVRGILTDAEVDALATRTLESGGFVSNKSLPDGSQIPYELNINYLDALSPRAANEPAPAAARKFLTAQAMMLSLQGMPGIYFHSLFGSRGDIAAVNSSGIKRRINRAKTERALLERELQEASSLRALVFDGYRGLLRMRREHAAFSPVSGQFVPEIDPRVFAVLRETPDGTDRQLCLHNVSAQSVTLPRGPLLSQPQTLEPFGFRWLPAHGAQGSNRSR